VFDAVGDARRGLPPARPDTSSILARRQIQAALDRARDQGMRIEQMARMFRLRSSELWRDKP